MSSFKKTTFKKMLLTLSAASVVSAIAMHSIAANQNTVHSNTVAAPQAQQHVVNQHAVAAIKVSTVQQALNEADDHKVKLHGYVVKAIGDEKYQFRDQTGTITVDIDDELWQGRAISANMPITIWGEVDIDYKPMKRVEIDVDAVQF